MVRNSQSLVCGSRGGIPGGRSLVELAGGAGHCDCAPFSDAPPDPQAAPSPGLPPATPHSPGCPQPSGSPAPGRPPRTPQAPRVPDHARTLPGTPPPHKGPSPAEKLTWQPASAPPAPPSREGPPGGAEPPGRGRRGRCRAAPTMGRRGAGRPAR